MNISNAYHILAKRFNKPPFKSIINDTFLEMLTVLYTEDEALFVSKMPVIQSGSKKIAKIMNRPEGEVLPILEDLAKRGLICYFDVSYERQYFVMPLIPGLFEVQMCLAPDSEKTRRFAQLCDEYLNAEYFNNIFKNKEANIFKIIPIETSVTAKSGVLPSEKIREVIDMHDTWSLAHYCQCRRQKELIGKGCNKPKDVCMQFGIAAKFVEKMGLGRLVSKTEILEAVDRAEEAGLIHLTDNVEKASISCNCCGDCCIAIANLSRYNVPRVFTNSRYITEVDYSLCNSCGKCTKYCSLGALHIYNSKLMLSSHRCIGCGACTGKCPSKALKLADRGEESLLPKNFGQMIAGVGMQMTGLHKFLKPVAPQFTRVIGNWIHKKITNI